MADYGCDPLWWVDAGIGNIDPTKLPLSEDRIKRLYKWAEVYNNTLNWDDPASSSLPNTEAEKAFEQEGINLWRQLQKELEPNYEVVYFSDRLRRVVNHPNELEVLHKFSFNTEISPL